MLGKRIEVKFFRINNDIEQWQKKN